MKFWGYRAFENDATVKWLTKEVVGRRMDHPLGSSIPIEQVFGLFWEWGRGEPHALMTLKEKEEIESTTIAACEVLAAMHGRPGVNVPSIVQDAAAAAKGKVSDSLLSRGAKYVERIAEKSELAKRWQLTPHYASWRAYLKELTQRLK